jgi:peptide/nickel transport system permease protein
MTITRRRAGAAIIALLAVLCAAGTGLATHDPGAQFADYSFAPPMWPRIVDASGTWRLPFVYPLRLEDRLARTYSLDRQKPQPIRWLHDGKLASVPGTPWFPLGTDSLGRDVFARLVIGARLTLGVAAVATVLSLSLGALVGGAAAILGNGPAHLLLKAADFVIALPVLYLVLTLRASLPLVLSPMEVFWAITMVLAFAGWPLIARGTHAIVSRENATEYAEAARAAGAGRTRILLRHLLPAARGFLGVQATLLVPGFILAEATLSFVGLGFPEVSPSWGVMLQESGGGRILAEAPWLLTPAIAIAITVLSVNLLTDTWPAAALEPGRNA